MLGLDAERKTNSRKKSPFSIDFASLNRTLKGLGGGGGEETANYESKFKLWVQIVISAFRN